MSRLTNAALVDQEFCRLLLAQPAAALAQGYNGEAFQLAPHEMQFVLSSRAGSLVEFAQAWVSQIGV